MVPPWYFPWHVMKKRARLKAMAELAQFVFAQHMGLARIHDEFRPSNTDAGDAQKACVGCLVHLNGKEIEMVECPIRFGGRPLGRGRVLLH